MVRLRICYRMKAVMSDLGGILVKSVVLDYSEVRNVVLTKLRLNERRKQRLNDSDAKKRP